MIGAAPKRLAPSASDDAHTDPHPPSPGRHHLPDPLEDRGHTTIHERVIEAVAGRIAREEPGVRGVARQVLGLTVPSADAESSPRVEAIVAGDVVSLQVRLSVLYPSPIHAVTDRIRGRLIEQLATLTGKRVGVVDIIVVGLHHPSVPQRVIR